MHTASAERLPDSTRILYVAEISACTVTLLDLTPILVDLIDNILIELMRRKDRPCCKCIGKRFGDRDIVRTVCVAIARRLQANLNSDAGAVCRQRTRSFSQLIVFITGV